MKTPKHCQVWKTDVRPYNSVLYLVVGRNAKAIAKARQKFNDKLGVCKYWNGHGAMCSHNGGSVGLFFQRESMSHGNIAHEVFHAVARVMDYAGAKFDPDNCEPWTYLAEWMTDWIYREAMP